MAKSSISVLPSENKELKNNISYFGKLKQFKVIDNYIIVEYQNGYLYIRFYPHDILNINYVKEGDNFESPSDVIELNCINLTEDVKTTYVDNKVILEFRKYNIELLDNSLTIRFNDKIIYQNTATAVINEKQTMIELVNNEQYKFYGFGEKPGFSLDKQGTKTSNWATDQYTPHCELDQEMYLAINFNITSYDANNHVGIFVDNPTRISYDMTNQSFWSIKSDINNLDLYLIPDDNLKNIVSKYTLLTGRSFLPPKWALGHHQSRHSYATYQEIEELVDNYQENNLLLDAIYLDILAMDKYQSFTFNEDIKNNWEKINQLVNQNNIQIIPIVNPGVKIDNQYYKEGLNKDYFIKNEFNQLAIDSVWPGQCVFPNYYNKEVRKWWASLHEFYLSYGIKSFWNDMNEPACFNETKTLPLSNKCIGDNKTYSHYEVHNKYAYYQNKALNDYLKPLLNNQRLFLVTRSGYAGIQKYSSVWTGDNFSYYWQMKQGITMLLNMGLSGINVCGVDLGGFAENCNPQLLVRWYQAYVLTAFYRNHYSINLVNQEPYAFGKNYSLIIKKYIDLRYELLPYIYTYMYNSTIDGQPLIRPLVLDYFDDENSHNINDQYLCGENILVSPILDQNKTSRITYFPQGKWINYFTKEVYEGNKEYITHAKLDELPLFIKLGSIIVKTNSLKQYQKNGLFKDVIFEIYPDQCNKKVKSTFYDDDGETYDYQNNKNILFDLEFVDNKLYATIKNKGLDFVKDSYKAQYYNTDTRTFNKIEIIWKD